ncbi:hypothetical protein A3G14_03855 [Candidatus Curtissbacteria bacterium RIFCSPLOWO2_12_FULL_38_9]|uniref:Soluble ligand binding domain-containing protein n=1 Tax=Candidatus Curtissbacteria bacterium RIFCSPLOWO2_12_FULL_38_9 TaxID=1797735 RepID=A0A1F5IC69_9BACT|nr:MAG: hypothetical protein A3G14_03855 [Candidatus Curtissbacteria bacterium RIFCSPLOWO2_12_FULL_38_9]
MSESLENFWENNKAKTAVVGMFLFGLFLLAFGVGTFALKDSGEDDAIKIISVEQGDPLNKIIVHVDGAVNKPGVYELTIDSRVNDLVAAAGGLTEDANTQAINLAAKLSDGQKAHIASINVNTASEAQLDTLPGVGPVTAGKIIASRPYSSVEELLSKKAVGRATFDKIKDLVTVY